MYNISSETLWTFARTFFSQALGYFVVVGLVFAVVWWWGRERFRKARIPAPDKCNRVQIRREVGNTLVTLATGTVNASLLLWLYAAGRTSLDSGPTSLGAILGWLAVVLLFNDAWFYGWHRLLHRPWFFRHVHAVHHKSVDVNPFTSYSFHLVEGLILGGWVIPAVLLLPIPLSLLGLLQIIGLANNVMSHLGYEFLPRWLLRIPVLRWINTATFHSLHHTRLRGNFGLQTRLWDKLFGTEIADYEAVFLARGGLHQSGNKAELSR